jgi:hypothetical protein
MAGPQYYQYSYQGTSQTLITAIANGDLNGDGITSTFHQDGSVISGRLVVAPSITEVSAEE